MHYIYNILNHIAQFHIKLIALWNAKLKLFVDGRKTVFTTLEEKLSQDDDIVWFHVASLGEYEQAVPIIEAFKQEHPTYKTLVSFFSPSGYEVKKNTTLVDVVVYLPMDTSGNANRFIKMVNPRMAIFIKYEIWPNYLRVLKQNDIPTILASALFRPSQIYFKPYGGFMLKALRKFDHIFVQNESSKFLLEQKDFNNITISGDTRFDRVSHQIEMDNRLEFVKEFKGDALCIVCGSTWPDDIAILIDFINTTVSSAEKNVKFIIAPHEIKPDKIDAIRQQITGRHISYSTMNNRNLEDFDVLIIDTIGLLTKIYDYADVAYVGGAMGSTGLHNILEPATFGVPIVIGKHFDDFPEAKKLQQLAGLFSVEDSEGLKGIMDKLIQYKSFREKTGLINEHFINSNTGATRIISEYITRNLS